MSTTHLDRALVDVGELLEEHTGQANPADLARWADDPAGWDLHADRDPVDYQRAVMESVVENRFTAWRSCHSAGKEWVAGSLAVWGAYARRMLVLVVSATEKQVLGQTMREVRRAWRAARKAHGIGGQLFQGSVRIGGEDRIIALTGSANVDALTGWHDPENGVLVIISEGQGEALESVAYDAALSNANTAKGRILAMGNPVRPVGRFYEIHQREHWERFKTSAFDTPNVKAGKVVRPGFPGPNWPQEVEQECHGTDNPFYQGRCLAEFPDQGEDDLIGRERVDAALERHRTGELEEEAEGEPYVLGLDPAGLGGDASALTLWQGPVVRRYVKWRGLEATELADRVEAVVRDLVKDGPGVSTVYVDEIGIGFGVKSILKEKLPQMKYWTLSGEGWKRKGVERSVQAEGVNVSSKPGNPDRFVRRKDELLWGLREDLVEGRIALAPHEDLVEEIMAVSMRQTPAGKIESESKDRMRARLGRSPDLLDSLLIGMSSRVPDGRRRVRFSFR